jgi:hypothetical protein
MGLWVFLERERERERESMYSKFLSLCHQQQPSPHLPILFQVSHKSFFSFLFCPKSHYLFLFFLLPLLLLWLYFILIKFHSFPGRGGWGFSCGGGAIWCSQMYLIWFTKCPMVICYGSQFVPNSSKLYSICFAQNPPKSSSCKVHTYPQKKILLYAYFWEWLKYVHHPHFYLGECESECCSLFFGWRNQRSAKNPKGKKIKINVLLITLT